VAVARATAVFNKQDKASAPLSGKLAVPTDKTIPRLIAGLMIFQDLVYNRKRLDIACSSSAQNQNLDCRTNPSNDKKTPNHWFPPEFQG
jgi:hypothetical protein